jgi:cobalt-zinc-cadmium efflux system outer membrane protein
MKSNTLKRKSFLAVLMLFFSAGTRAQDSIHITLPEAEKQFLNNNLSLLAAKYNIDIGKAQLIQTKLYNNPNLTFAGNLYNPDNRKLADLSNKTGEYAISLQQLVILAGKRNKQIKLAETGISLAEQKFFDLLRTLRYSLRSDFYNAYYLQNSVETYQRQIVSLEKLNAAYQDLLAKGLVTLKDAVRIKSLLYSLKADQVLLQNQLNDLQSELQLLLQNNKAYFIPRVENTTENLSIRRFPLADLIDTAYANRYDLKQAETTQVYNQQNYVLQKSLAVPDLTIGAGFDKRGSFVTNASFFSIAIDLPFFNRNQGNIKAAKIALDQGKTFIQQQKLTVESEVENAYKKALNTDKMLQSMDPGFREQFEKLLTGITENFQRKNISLIEFTDFYESYKQNILQFNHLQSEKMQAIEALHFAIGKTIFYN